MYLAHLYEYSLCKSMLLLWRKFVKFCGRKIAENIGYYLNVALWTRYCERMSAIGSIVSNTYRRPCVSGHRCCRDAGAGVPLVETSTVVVS